MTFFGCTERPTDMLISTFLPPIYPDYAGVTIPVDIAPLNFCVDGADVVDVEVHGDNGHMLIANGKWADFDVDGWKSLVAENVGGKLTFSVSTKVASKWVRYADFHVFVSSDTLSDFGLVYRKIAPGYETFSNIGIYQRDVHSFSEYPIVESTAVPGECINCHSFKGTDPSCFSLHFRGVHGATLVQRDGERHWLNTKTDSTIANCMYPYWHPSGNYCAYSLNLVHQCFFTSNNQYIEVFDKASDCVVLDVRNNQLILSPSMQTSDFETYPVFSADGKSIFYCTSKPHDVPLEYLKMRYDLCRVSFDADNGSIGNDVDTLLKVSSAGHSITFPSPSHDGRYLIYCLSDFGVFPINHKEADLWIMNLQTGVSRPLDEVNSDDTESYHSWSTNSRWIVFSSRRGDGLYSRLYIAHIDADGNAGKPFLLPQRNPLSFYSSSPYSYNVPEFVSSPVEFDVQSAFDEVFSSQREQVHVR